MMTWITGAVMCLSAMAAQGQEVTIRGSVVDGEGNPVAGASVASTYLEGNPARGTTTGEDGRFELVERSYGRAMAVLVMDGERKRGAVSSYEPHELGEERSLTVGPLVEVRGRIISTELGKPPPWINVYANLMPGRIRISRFMSRDGTEFSFLLPAGDYELHMYGTDIKRRLIPQEVEGSEGNIDLGEIDIEATEIARMYGKAPPEWSVTAARGVPENVQLKDFLGRYVLLEFWGFW